MQEKIGYCRQKAAECAARAEEATDKETRALFLKFRNSWISAADRYEALGAAGPGKTAELRPSAFTREPSTSVWGRHPNDARTDTTVERLGAS
jgi:hypothetical protein